MIAFRNTQINEDSFLLNGSNAWRFGLRGVCILMVLWIAVGIAMHAWTRDPIGWLLVLMLGGGLVVQWLRGYFAWLKEAATYAFEKPALAVIPAKLPDEHADAELQRELRHYNVELAVLKSGFRRLKREIGWALLAVSVDRMKRRVDDVLNSLEFTMLTEAAADLRVRHDALKERIGDT